MIQRNHEEKKGIRLHASNVGGARDAPKRFRSPDACASRTRRCIFLPEGRPIERNTWRCGCAGDAGPGPGPRAPIRLVSSRKRAVVGHLIATLFIVGKHARQQHLLFITRAPRDRSASRAYAFCNDDPRGISSECCPRRSSFLDHKTV